MRIILRKFRSSDDGAVTVDWVVLCAAVVVLGASIIVTVTTGAVDLADNTIKVKPGDV